MPLPQPISTYGYKGYTREFVRVSPLANDVRPTNTKVIPMSLINESDMVGDVSNQVTTNRTVTVTKKEGSYTVLAGGHRFHTDIINLGTASALTDDSTLEFGGAADVRITITEHQYGERVRKYAYLEVLGQ